MAIYMAVIYGII